MRSVILFILCCPCIAATAQFNAKDIHADFTLYERRISFDKYLRDKTIRSVFDQPLDSNSEDYYREACLAISQFQLRSEVIEKGFSTLFDHYPQLEPPTKRALLEAVYGNYPTDYVNDIKKLLAIETMPKLFAMQALYLYRMDHSRQSVSFLEQKIVERFPAYGQVPVLVELDRYLHTHEAAIRTPIPDIHAVFEYNENAGHKTIYSFQRWDRDWPGMAVIQLEDGRFARDSSGSLLVFQQLARSASDLPYFITNGSTPQGIYSIQGTAVSHNHLIGPTPNIQLVMPGEADSVFWHENYDSSVSRLDNYLKLLPASWRNYTPMTEAYAAGNIGRTEIIAHGTAIDPEYYKGKSYYPLTPTMGCLCARETWNLFTGTLLQSEQLRLANTFVSTPATTGYLFVINIDNRSQPVGKEEIEKIVNSFQQREKQKKEMPE